MPSTARIADHPRLGAAHGLYILECDTLAEIGRAISLPSKHFVALLVGDFTSTPTDEITRVTQIMIDKGARYFCAWGPGCEIAHEAFDYACCLFDPDNDDEVILTTDHRRDPIEDAIWYILNCAQPTPEYARDWTATIAIAIAQPRHAQTIREAFRDTTFSDKHGPRIDEAT